MADINGISVQHGQIETVITCYQDNHGNFIITEETPALEDYQVIVASFDDTLDTGVADYAY